MAALYVSCRYVHHFDDFTTQCTFVKNNSDCQQVQGIFNYLNFVYCTAAGLSLIPIIISCLWLLMLFIIVGRTADDFFCPALDVTAKFFKLSHNVAGVTFLAFGNGAPDIFSSLAGVTQMRPELVIGALFGGGIFVTTVVAGSIILVSPFDMMQRPFLRDVIFYLVSVFWTFSLYYTGKITLYHSIGFILLYIIYLIVVLVGHYIYQKWLKPTVLRNMIKKHSIITITVASPDGSVVCQNYNEENKENENYFWRRRSLERRHSRSVSRSHSQSSMNSEGSSNGPSIILTPRTSIVSESGHLDVPKTRTISEESTPLITSCSSLSLLPEDFTESKKFLRTVSPIDLDLWSEFQTWQKILRIVASPLVLLLKITIPVVDRDKFNDNWCKSLIIVNIISCPLFFCFALGYGTRLINGVFPVCGLLLMFSVILSIIIYITSCNDQPPVYHVAFGFLGFVASVIWIYLLSSEIVSVLKMVGVVMHLSDTILGVTVLAWGNSLPDLVANVSLAKQNLPRMGMSGCFGGPLFNLLMGVGIPFTILTINNSSRMILVNYFTSTTIITVFLCISLISSLIIIPLMRFHTYKAYGLYLITIYLFFLVIAILNESGAIK